MAHQAPEDARDSDPSGHNAQVKPAQKKQITKSEEHRGDAAKSGARSDVDQETVNELKD